MNNTATLIFPGGETMTEFLASLKEMRESQKEMDKRQDELTKKMEETDRQMKETDRRMKETDRRMGFLHNSFGELAEHMVAPGIADKFNELGHHFDGVACGGYEIRDNKGKTIAEVDVLLENGDCLMAVEVKTKPKIQDIDHHIKRLEILREHRNKKNDKRKIYGAIAGAVFSSLEKEASIQAGFYVLEQSGDTMKIEIPEGFVPREW